MTSTTSDFPPTASGSRQPKDERVNFQIDDLVLRRPEPQDAEALYRQKNDPEVANLLGGFSLGQSRADIVDWIERHRRMPNEALWVIAQAKDDQCLGHVGLYQIDHRVRSAEFAIMVGESSAQGKGIGKKVTRFVVRYGFEMLNLNRIQLSFLATNARARALYESLGFQHEGVQRQAQYKQGAYVDVVLMSLLRDEWAHAP